MSRSELYGESIFTSFRSFNGFVPLVEEHIARLFESTNEYFFSGRLTLAEFQNYFIKKLELESKIKKKPNHYFRISFVANKQLGLVMREFAVSDIEVNMSIHELGVPNKPQRLCFSQSPFSDSYIPIKSGSYFQNLRAKQLALRNRYDDVLFFRDDKILESAFANIVFVKDNHFFTPKAKGVLPGICLKLVSHYCRDLGLNFTEIEIKKDQVADFEMAFLTNSVQLLTPIASIEHNVFNTKSSFEFIKTFSEYVNNGMKR